MTIIEREESIFNMGIKAFTALSTSELKYICKHDLIKIDYVANKLNRKKMREQILEKRNAISVENKKAYFEKCINRFTKRTENFQNQIDEFDKKYGPKFARAFNERLELDKKFNHDLKILEYYKNMLNKLNEI